jgi:alanine dehydrogenase
LPYALKLANLGFKAAVLADSGLAEGVNTYAGKLTYQAVALAQGREFTPLGQLLES